jgi:hypothetical protein
MSKPEATVPIDDLARTLDALDALDALEGPIPLLPELHAQRRGIEGSDPLLTKLRKLIDQEGLEAAPLPAGRRNGLAVRGRRGRAASRATAGEVRRCGSVTNR